MRPHLIEWQWSDYADKHRDRANLLLHIVAVPLFWLGVAMLALALVRLSAPLAIYALVAMLVSLVAQGRGHKREAETPAPFEGALDFPTRFVTEQFVTFPRYV